MFQPITRHLHPPELRRAGDGQAVVIIFITGKASLDGGSFVKRSSVEQEIIGFALPLFDQLTHFFKDQRILCCCGKFIAQRDIVVAWGQREVGQGGQDLRAVAGATLDLRPLAVEQANLVVRWRGRRGDELPLACGKSFVNHDFIKIQIIMVGGESALYRGCGVKGPGVLEVVVGFLFRRRATFAVGLQGQAVGRRLLAPRRQLQAIVASGQPQSWQIDPTQGARLPIGKLTIWAIVEIERTTLAQR